MKRTILFDQTLAETLNEKVKKIAGHLFLFCEYNTGIYPVFNADAMFLLGVLNLYRVTIDASVVHKLRRVVDRSSSASLRGIYKEQIQPIVNESQMLRSVIAHNQGNSKRGATFAYQQWISERIQKRSIDGVEDYTILLQALSDRADLLVSSLETFLESAASLHKKEIVLAWEELLLEFYRKDQGRRIILHQIAEAYCALSVAHRNTTVNGGGIGKSQIAAWIKNRYLWDFLTEKKKWSNFLTENKELSQKTKQKIQEKIEEAEKKIQSQEKYIASKNMRKADELTPYDYLDVYVMDVLDTLKGRLNNVKEGDTMLPEGLLQEIIIVELRRIPLP